MCSNIVDVSERRVILLNKFDWKNRLGFRLRISNIPQNRIFGCVAITKWRNPRRVHSSERSKNVISNFDRAYFQCVCVCSCMKSTFLCIPKSSLSFDSFSFDFPKRPFRACVVTHFALINDHLHFSRRMY